MPSIFFVCEAVPKSPPPPQGQPPLDVMYMYSHVMNRCRAVRDAPAVMNVASGVKGQTFPAVNYCDRRQRPRTLGSWVRIPLRAWMDVCVFFCWQRPYDGPIPCL